MRYFFILTYIIFYFLQQFIFYCEAGTYHALPVYYNGHIQTVPMMYIQPAADECQFYIQEEQAQVKSSQHRGRADHRRKPSNRQVRENKESKTDSNALLFLFFRLSGRFRRQLFPHFNSLDGR